MMNLYFTALRAMIYAVEAEPDETRAWNPMTRDNGAKLPNSMPPAATPTFFVVKILPGAAVPAGNYYI